MQNQIAGLPQHQSSQKYCKVLDTSVISDKIFTAHSSQLTAHNIISFYIISHKIDRIVVIAAHRFPVRLKNIFL